MNNVILVATGVQNRAGYTVNLPEGFPSLVSGNNPYLEAVSDAPVRVNGVQFEGDTPIIRAAAFRSAWRERAVERVMGGKVGGAKTEDGTVKPNTMITLTKGGIMGTKEDTDLVTPDEAMRQSKTMRRTNPLMAAFGGSFPNFMGGSVQVGNLYPETAFKIRKQSINRGNIRNTLLQSLVADTGAAFDRAIAPLNEEKKEALKAVEKGIADGIKALKGLQRGTADYLSASDDLNGLKEQKKAIEADFKARKNALAAEHGETSTSLLQSFSAADALYGIPAGQTWKQRIRITNASDAEVGILLDSLKSFYDENGFGGMNVGGRSASGFGADLHLEYDIAFYDAEADEWVKDGTLAEFGPRAMACVEALKAGGFDYIGSIPDRATKKAKAK